MLGHGSPGLARIGQISNCYAKLGHV